MSYPYILYKNTSTGPVPQAQFNLTASSIQGIYSAQLLSWHINEEGYIMSHDNNGFSLISKNPIPKLPSNISYKDIYLYPLNNLLEYLNIMSSPTNLKHGVSSDLNYHIVDFVSDDIHRINDTDSFTHVIRYCGRYDISKLFAMSFESLATELLETGRVNSTELDIRSRKYFKLFLN
jgi:hypothetical protein